MHGDLGASDAAFSLGHQWIGTEHLLLALTQQRNARTLAHQTLLECGVTQQIVRSKLTPHQRSDSEQRWVSPNPRFEKVEGRAAGLALAAGRPEPSAEDFLLALIWERKGPHANILVDCSVEAESLVEALHQRGVVIPPNKPRPFRKSVPFGERVPLTDEEWDSCLPYVLYELLPEDTGFSFNRDTDGPYAIADAGIDLVPYLAQANEEVDTLVLDGAATTRHEAVFVWLKRFAAHGDRND